MKQKEIFLHSEGDAWFTRNVQSIAGKKLPDDDPLLRELLKLPPMKAGGKISVLEVGCGEGTRLAWLKNNLDVDCYGIDPSAQAVLAACSKGIKAQQGTADHLAFDDKSFDIVIFGFCLYLCDREDLFQIASEADRALKTDGWLMIMDFFSPTPRAKIYHHRPGLQSFKMDYRTLWDWHPDYECITHQVRHHSNASYTDDPDEWVGISVLRKSSRKAIVA